MVIAYHVILTGYGHWLPNDPRGSMSATPRSGKLLTLGPMHFERKKTQPTREDLKSFYRDARERLEHETIWFDSPHREIIAQSFAEVVKVRRYTCLACAILRNHAHLMIRKHRERVETMIAELRTASGAALRSAQLSPPQHPVWSSDLFKRFLFTGDDVRRVARYIQDNPAKERLPPQQFGFVTEYRGEWDRT